MRQASRFKAFPYILIAAVLVAALPLNSFAVSLESVSLSSDLIYNILGANDFDYFSFTHPNLPSSIDISGSFYTDSYILYSDFSLPVVSRSFRFTKIAAMNGSNGFLSLYLPIFVTDLSSLDLDFFYGSSLLSDDPFYPFNLITISVVDDDNVLFDIPFSSNNGSYTYSFSSDSSSFPIGRCRAFYSSSSFFDADYLKLIFEYNPSSTDLVQTDFVFALSPLSSLSTPSSNVSSLINSMSVLASLIDSLIAHESSSDAEILSYLSQILAAIQSGGGSGGSSDSEITGPPSEESEDILQEGAEKQEQLEQLGQALGDVPKPSIQDVSQLIDPNVSLSTSSPQMVQTALNIVYSWDKFLAILALVIALGTISYILFGKKS